MIWDYDKLFAEGNVVGLKNLQENKIFAKEIHKKKYWKEKGHVNWSLYFNNSLSMVNIGNFDFEIQYIIRLDEHGNVIEKLFDRDTDMSKPMPKLETGMFVRVNAYGESKLGFVDAEQNHVIYQSGGYDFIDDDTETPMKGIFLKIVEVYEKEACWFDYCCEDSLIWRSSDYQAYLDSKN